jgi:preprotein translocase subunit SecD
MTVFDSNLAMLMAAAVLFFLGTGTIKGFAVTLSIGVAVSMLTSIFITRVFIDMASKTQMKHKLFNAKRGKNETI